ncbi:MAG: hypothetical protein LUF78_09780 [Clostridiales bacterium]|nr:hypothetical protein [Clostridiales bacterium]MCD8154954.1 hypothetical protein [Clostridiales bacterium]
MARTVGMEALEQKIEKAQERVNRTKTAYEEAENELQKLLEKKAALEEQELIRAIAGSGKSHEEIMRFLTGENAQEQR